MKKILNYLKYVGMQHKVILYIISSKLIIRYAEC